MELFDIILIAIGLAMDSFAVSITAGLILQRCKPKDFLPIGLYMGIFQAGMPVLGWLAGTGLQKYIEAYDHWIAFGLLFIIGGKMVYENLIKGNPHCFNPRKQIVLLGLAVATSIDALIVGVNFGVMQISIIQPIIIIGCITAFLSALGVFLGKTFKKLYFFKLETIGGFVLIGIGVKILIEHTLLTQ